LEPVKIEELELDDRPKDPQAAAPNSSFASSSNSSIVNWEKDKYEAPKEKISPPLQR